MVFIALGARVLVTELKAQPSVVWSAVNEARARAYARPIIISWPALATRIVSFRVTFPRNGLGDIPFVSLLPPFILLIPQLSLRFTTIDLLYYLARPSRRHEIHSETPFRDPLPYFYFTAFPACFL